MKKIVALVLALALALSLCTVAMAVTVTHNFVGGVTSSVDGYYYTATNSSLKMGDINTHTTQSVQTETRDGKTMKLYVPENYDGWAVTTEKYADHRVFDKNDKFVAYVTEADIDGMLVAVTEVAKSTKCGGFGVKTVKVDIPTIFDESEANGNYAYAGYGAGVPVLLNDKVVFVVDEALDAIPHEFTDDVTFKSVTDDTIVSVKCDECGKTFKVVETLGEYTGDFDAVSLAGYYILLDDAKVAADTTTVDSSKTFDAGVAMYVGLSLMSVAGSAVVIGKKKEF